MFNIGLLRLEHKNLFVGIFDHAYILHRAAIISHDNQNGMLI